jgi:hypothetical protein
VTVEVWHAVNPIDVASARKRPGARDKRRLSNDIEKAHRKHDR